MEGLRHQPPFNFKRIEYREASTFKTGDLVWAFSQSEWKRGVVIRLSGQWVEVETEETRRYLWRPLRLPYCENNIWPRTRERE